MMDTELALRLQYALDHWHDADSEARHRFEDYIKNYTNPAYERIKKLLEDARMITEADLQKRITI